MTKSKKAILIVLPLLFLTGGAVFLSFYNQEGFTGNRIKNPNAYLLDIKTMNGTECGDCPDMEKCQSVGMIISNNSEALKNLRG